MIAEKIVEEMGVFQRIQSSMLGTMKSLVERAEKSGRLLIGLKHEVLHLKVALCLTWIGFVAVKIWSSFQC